MLKSCLINFVSAAVLDLGLVWTVAPPSLRQQDARIDKHAHGQPRVAHGQRGSLTVMPFLHLLRHENSLVW